MIRRFVAVCVLGLLAPTGLADTAAPGFSVAARSASPVIGVDPFGLFFDVHGIGVDLASGDLVAFDGTEIVRMGPDGTTTVVYETLVSPGYPSLIAVDPTESFFVVGESSAGRIFRVDLATAQVTVLATVPFAYDAAFSPGGELFMTHAPNVVGIGGTTISRVDLVTGDLTTVANVAGPSGPVAFDATGGLVYGVVDPSFAPGTSRIVGWSAAQIAGPLPLTEADAAVVSTGWDNVAFLAGDSESGAWLLIENDGADVPEVWRAGATKASSRVVATGPPGTFMSNLQFDPDPGLSSFQPFQPANGGRARYSLSDFVSGTLVRYEARPARPTTWLAGPGAGGVGVTTLGVSGARPGGAVLFWFTLMKFVEPTETVFFLGDLPPLFWSFGKNPFKELQLYIPADANGEATFTFYNPGWGPGLMGFHGLLLDAGLAIEGTATVAIL